MSDFYQSQRMMRMMRQAALQRGVIAVLDIGEVYSHRGILVDPEFGGEALWTTKIQDLATTYANLGRDDADEVLIPNVMVHLIRVDLPPDFMPVTRA